MNGHCDSLSLTKKTEVSSASRFIHKTFVKSSYRRFIESTSERGLKFYSMLNKVLTSARNETTVRPGNTFNGCIYRFKVLKNNS